MNAVQRPPSPALTPESPISWERRWVLGFAALILAVTSLPYLLGFAREGSGWVFSGFVFGVEDGNSYIAKMASGAAGAWLFRTPYTAAPQRGVLAFLPYLLLGKLATPPGQHEQLVALFHLFRVGAGFLAVLATYDFLAFFLRDRRARRWALALAVLGGGLGWVLVLAGQGDWLGSLPLEFYSPETFGFLGLYGVPHLALARATLLWGLLAYLRSAQAARHDLQGGLRWRAALKIGLLWLLTALAQPLAALVFGGVIGLHLLVSSLWIAARMRVFGRKPPSAVARPRWSGRALRVWKNNLRMVTAAATIPAPFILYNCLAFYLDPFLKIWTGQNRILSPHPLHYLLAYGLLLPFTARGARKLLRRRPWEALLLLPWVLALPVLAYAPFNLQRRLPEAIWIAVVVLAAVGSPAAGRAGPKKNFPFTLAVQALVFPSTLLLLAGGSLASGRPALPVFRPAQEVQAFHFLQQQAVPGQAVLAAFETGNALPAWAPLRVVIGHGPESADLDELRPRVAAFYDPTTPDPERLALLRETGAAYVFWGPAEGALGSWDPSQATYLKPIYQSGPYRIFRVALPPE